MAALREIQQRVAGRPYGRRSGSFSSFVRLNREFHDVLVGASRNRMLVGALGSLYHDSLVSRTRHGRGVPGLELINAEHEAIVDALERRNPAEAEAAVVRHIRDGAARTLAALEGA